MGKLTHLLRSNRTQAVRLPREVAFPETVTDVRIVKDGNRRVIVPADASWDDDFAEAPQRDFPDRPDQPEIQEREPFAW
jgi:antitoxin VapB